MSYDSSDLGWLFEDREKVFAECKMVGPVQRVEIETGKEAPSYFDQLTQEFRSSLRLLDNSQKSLKLEFAKKIEGMQKQLAKSDLDEIERTRLVQELEDTLAQKENQVFSYYAENTAQKATIEADYKIQLYAGEAEAAYLKLDFDKTDDELLPNVLGTKNSQFTTDYILNNLEKDFAEGKKIPSQEFDKYVKAGGKDAVNKVVTIAKYFQGLAKAADLPLERYLKNYFPSLIGKLENLDESAKALKELNKKLGVNRANEVPFYEQARTGDFAAAKVPLVEQINYYRNSVIRSIQHGYANDIIVKLNSDPNLFGLNEVHIGATEQIVKNMIEFKPTSKFGKLMKAGRDSFYKISLINNIGSSITNLTSIPTMISPKFGYARTMIALSKVREQNALTDVLDSFNIGSMEDAISSYDNQVNIKSKKDLNLYKYDAFTRSERFLTRITGIASLMKKYGGYENAVDVLEKVLAKGDHKELIDSMAPIRSEVADTLFHSKAFDANANTKTALGEIQNALMSLMRHPIRESRMLYDIVSEIKSPKNITRAEATKQLSRYLFAKTLVMGKSAVWFAVPTPIMHMINEYAPEVRKDIEDVAMFLDYVSPPRWIKGTVPINFENSQNLTWAPEMIWGLFQSKGKIEAPILNYIGNAGKSVYKVIRNKGDQKDWIRFVSLAATAPKGGVIQIGPVAIGQRQVEKLGNMIVDLIDGEMEYAGVTKKIEGLEDVKEVITRGIVSYTNAESQILKSTQEDQHLYYRRYLLGLAMAGKSDKRTYAMLAKYGYDGDEMKLKESLEKSINKYEGVPDEIKNKAIREIYGY
jgi:hypothetical protein